MRTASCWLSSSLLLIACSFSAASGALTEMVATNDLVLEPGSHSMRLIVRASHIKIDGQGATLIGPGQIGAPNSLEAAGIGVLVEGAVDVILTNLHVHGFATGLLARRAEALSVSGCDFSDNYHNPAHGWGELPARGGILCEQVLTASALTARRARSTPGIRRVF